MLDTDLKIYSSQVVNELATNGGLISDTEIITGQDENCFPAVGEAERLAGSKKYRKVGYKVADDEDGSLVSPKLWFDTPTPGDDWAVFFAGTQRDTIADISGADTGNDTEEKFGVAWLNADAAAGAATFALKLSDASLGSGNDAIFADGKSIRITDKATPTATSGNAEFHTISGTPVLVDDVLTITIAGTLAYSYTGNGDIGSARIMSVYEPATVATSYTTPQLTTTSGTFDDTTYPILLDNIGTTDEDITIEFTDATNFTVSGNSLGTIGTGNTSTEFAPLHPTFSKPRLTIPAGVWGGTWAAGETITFSMHPAIVPIWIKRIIPAAAGSVSLNVIKPWFGGEAG